MRKKQPSEQTPVYAVVHGSLRTQIFTGQYRPGDMLPSESHLCQEFGASRETVRRGLQQLENEGLIFSRPKIGYFVSQPNHNDMILSLSEELEGTELQYRDIHGILPDARLQELLDIPANRKVIEFSQISRDGDGQPVAFDVKYVPYARAYPSVESEIRYAVLPDLTFAKLSSFSVYSQITVTAVAAEGEPARALECPEGTPLLLIEQIFLQQDGSRVGVQLHYSRAPGASSRALRVTGSKNKKGYVPDGTYPLCYIVSRSASSWARDSIS